MDFTILLAAITVFSACFGAIVGSLGKYLLDRHMHNITNKRRIIRELKRTAYRAQSEDFLDALNECPAIFNKSGGTMDAWNKLKGTTKGLDKDKLIDFIERAFKEAGVKADRESIEKTFTLRDTADKTHRNP